VRTWVACNGKGTSQITHHTSHITHHTSHITHHTSHITHHTSHTCHATNGMSFSSARRHLHAALLLMQTLSGKQKQYKNKTETKIETHDPSPSYLYGMSLDEKPLGAKWLLALAFAANEAAPKFKRDGENALSSAAKMGEPRTSDGRLSPAAPRCALAAGMQTSIDPRSRDVLAGVKSLRDGNVVRLAEKRGAGASPRKRVEELRLGGR
jgi:hypothetical protein